MKRAVVTGMATGDGFAKTNVLEPCMLISSNQLIAIHAQVIYH